MDEPPSQKQRLALALHKLRDDADLTTRGLADKLGISQSIVTKVENLRVRAKPELVRVWAREAGASADVIEELVELAHFARVESARWQSDKPGGFVTQQRRVAAREETATSIRTFQPAAIPGLLQVHDYARRAIGFTKPAPDMMATKLNARMQRQAVLSSSKHFDFILGEPSFRWLVAPADVMAAQVRHIESVMTLPNVDVGVLPLMAETVDLYLHGFILYEGPDPEDALVVVDTWVDEQKIDDPEDVDAYRQAYERLRSAALFGDAAREVLDRIAEDMRRISE